jgi:hypothetical protein
MGYSEKPEILTEVAGSLAWDRRSQTAPDGVRRPFAEHVRQQRQLDEFPQNRAKGTALRRYNSFGCLPMTDYAKWGE